MGMNSKSAVLLFFAHWNICAICFINMEDSEKSLKPWS